MRPKCNKDWLNVGYHTGSEPPVKQCKKVLRFQYMRSTSWAVKPALTPFR